MSWHVDTVYLSHALKFADSVVRRQNENMTIALQETYEFDKLVFCSNAMADVCNLARKTAATELPVLIEGETGTGKELMARTVHLLSGRSSAYISGAKLRRIDRWVIAIWEVQCFL